MRGGMDRWTDGWTDVRLKIPPVLYRTSALWGRCPKSERDRQRHGHVGTDRDTGRHKVFKKKRERARYAEAETENHEEKMCVITFDSSPEQARFIDLILVSCDSFHGYVTCRHTPI